MNNTTPATLEARKSLRARNVRLGLILASVALVFFMGFITRLVMLRH